MGKHLQCQCERGFRGQTGANKVCHPWNHPLMGSRSLNYYVQTRWYEHGGHTWTASGGVVEACNSRKLNLFVLVCLQCAKLDHIKLVACIQPPPASGQFRRGVVTMPASKQHLIHNHNGISFHYVHEKNKNKRACKYHQIKFSFVFVQQGRKTNDYVLCFKRESASRDFVPLGLQLKWQCNTCVCMYVCVYVCMFVCMSAVCYVLHATRWIKKRRCL